MPESDDVGYFNNDNDLMKNDEYPTPNIECRCLQHTSELDIGRSIFKIILTACELPWKILFPYDFRQVLSVGHLRISKRLLGNKPMVEKKEDRVDLFGMFILILSVYVLAALLIDTLFTLDPQVSMVLKIVDDFVCGIFLIEFIVRFYQAKSKWIYMRWGWIDLISSIPTLEYLRFGRVFRMIRLFRIMLAIRSAKELIHHFQKNRVESAVVSMGMLAVLLLIFSSIAILKAEDVPNGNIKTASDALWWAFGTVTTIGYGDLYPVTTIGRIIAGVLILFGVGLFGMLSGLITSWFVGQRRIETES